jgi:putative Holliday junction resolvase
VRVIGLDIGEVRTGVAVSDADARVANPITVLDTKRVLADPRPLRDVVEDAEGDARLVVGLPLTMAGEEGPQAKRVRQLGDRLADLLAIPVDYIDERLSSEEAKRMLHAAGRSEKEMRGMLDMVAAALLLQSWLDAHREAPGGAGE